MKDKRPMLSIIVPIHKVEQYLEKCLNSILEQSFKGFELILVVGLPDEHCEEICDTYAEKDNRIIVLKKPAEGPSAERNAGIAIAKGIYLGFVDADDYIDYKMYEILVGEAEKAKAGVCMCRFACVYEKNKIVPNPAWEGNQQLTHDRIVKAYLTGEYMGTQLVVWNKVYRRELFNNVSFPKGCIHEDNFTTYKLLFSVEKVVYVDKVLYFYLQREGSLTKTQNEWTAIKAVEEMEEFLKSESDKLFYEINCAYVLAGISYLMGMAKSGLFDKVLFDKARNIVLVHYDRKNKYIRMQWQIHIFVLRYFSFVFLLYAKVYIKIKRSVFKKF